MMWVVGHHRLYVSHVCNGGTVQLEQATNNQMYVHYSSAYLPEIDSYQFATE